jgi:chromate transporter
LGLFGVSFLLPVLFASLAPQTAALFAAFYRSGALVFGGGHVVLPLLQQAVVRPGWVTDSAFMSGYGLAQAVPGPLFTFAAYLGAVMGPPPSGILGAAIALIAIFMPGLLLVYGMLPFWDGFRTRGGAQAAMRGANAAVVGILALALYTPVWTSAVRGQADFALAAGGFLALTVWNLPPWGVVLLLALAGAGGG